MDLSAESSLSSVTSITSDLFFFFFGLSNLTNWPPCLARFTALAATKQRLNQRTKRKSGPTRTQPLAIQQPLCGTLKPTKQRSNANASPQKKVFTLTRRRRRLKSKCKPPPQTRTGKWVSAFITAKYSAASRSVRRLQSETTNEGGCQPAMSV